MPESIARSNTRRPSSSLEVTPRMKPCESPNVMAPSESTLTLSPELPSGRSSMRRYLGLVCAAHQGGPCDDQRRARQRTHAGEQEHGGIAPPLRDESEPDDRGAARAEEGVRQRHDFAVLVGTRPLQDERVEG